MSSLISAISILGLILNMIGASILVRPFILTNSMIRKLGQYKTKGAVLGEGEKIEHNENLIKSFEESRDRSFEGISYIFVGFSLQIPQYFPNMAWYNDLIVLAFLSFADFLILRRIKLKNTLLKSN